MTYRLPLTLALLAFTGAAEARHLIWPFPSEPTGGAYPAPAPASLGALSWKFVVGGIAWGVELFNDESGALVTHLPHTDSGTLNYLYTRSPYTVAGYTWLKAEYMVVATSGAPVVTYPWTGCTDPAKIRLFLWSTSSTYRGTEYERWWSNIGEIPLTVGQWIVSIASDLEPVHWYSVLGRPALDNPTATAAFEAAKAGAWVGVTFGGCAAGHGVGVGGGDADFRLLRYGVQ